MKIALVSMPWQSVSSPSTGLGILGALIRTRAPQHEVQEFHAGIDWVEWCHEQTDGSITPMDYKRISEEGDYFFGTGDWVFTEALLAPNPQRDAEYLKLLRAKGRDTSVVERLYAIARPFIEDLAHRILKDAPALVGFSTTFMQNVPSLAVAKTIKRLAPATQIVFGGANCDGCQGVALQRNFPFVDFVVRGEGERALLGLLDALEGRNTLADVESLCWFDSAGVQRVNDAAPLPIPMNDVPRPDYDQWFATFNRSIVRRYFDAHLMLEAARGCWWGAATHCVFCGLNGTSMKFRSKSPELVWDEIVTLTERHRCLDVIMTDNIMDMRYLKTLAPLMAQSDFDIRMSYEIKANMKAEHVLAMEHAGIINVQPGIENLSSDVLALMGKGVQGTQNVQLLRDCKDAGISVAWNYLFGFPEEKPEHYESIVAQMPALVHLQPPNGHSRIALERFSPNFEKPELGFANREPASFYRYIYDLPNAAIEDMVYLFDTDARGIDLAVVKTLASAIRRWKTAFDSAGGDLIFWRDGNDVVLRDTRNGKDGIDRLDDWHAVAYVELMRATSVTGLTRLLHDRGFTLVESAVVAWLDEMVSRGYIFTDSGRYVALACVDIHQRRYVDEGLAIA